jgi:hypothetical protein
MLNLTRSQKHSWFDAPLPHLGGVLGLVQCFFRIVERFALQQHLVKKWEHTHATSIIEKCHLQRKFFQCCLARFERLVQFSQRLLKKYQDPKWISKRKERRTKDAVERGNAEAGNSKPTWQTWQTNISTHGYLSALLQLRRFDRRSIVHRSARGGEATQALALPNMRGTNLDERKANDESAIQNDFHYYSSTNTTYDFVPSTSSAMDATGGKAW